MCRICFRARLWWHGLAPEESWERAVGGWRSVWGEIRAVKDHDDGIAIWLVDDGAQGNCGTGDVKEQQVCPDGARLG